MPGRRVRGQKVDVLGVPLLAATRAEALADVESLCDGDRPALIAYANAHTLNLASRDASYRDLLQRASLVLNDGAGVALAARIGGDRFPENLNGSDFNVAILQLSARRDWPVFLLGGRPGVAERAATALRKRIPDLEIAGLHHGYFGRHDDAGIAALVRSSGARVLMVAMGNPLQEQWIDRHLPATGATVGVGVGAFLDFQAGEVRRAPAWMNRAGIEWVYRLGQEPGRLWRRYLLGNPVFLARVVRARARRR